MIFECSATDKLCTAPPRRLKEYLQGVVGKTARGREEVKILKMLLSGYGMAIDFLK